MTAISYQVEFSRSIMLEIETLMTQEHLYVAEEGKNIRERVIE